MDQTPDLFDVKFHFPYASVSVEKVSERALGIYQDNIRSGRKFCVRKTHRDYLINPDMLTYMEIAAHNSFF